MAVPQREERTYGAVTGWQGQIKGTLLNVTGTPTINDISGNVGASAAGNPLAGSAAVPASTTLYFFVPTAGASAVDVTLLMTHTGTAPTITLYKTLQDHVTEKMDASGGTTNRVTIAPTDSTQTTGSITNLRGEQGCILKIVTPAASTATFTVAEYSAL